ncbi:hypothetical protein, partial [Colwellia marinimaniae]
LLDQPSSQDQQKAVQHIAINGLGRDNSCAHLILSTSEQGHQAAPAPIGKRRPQLVKTIKLGGQLIAEAIVNSASSSLNVIKAQFAGKTLTKVNQPIIMDNLIPQG